MLGARGHDLGLSPEEGAQEAEGRAIVDRSAIALITGAVRGGGRRIRALAHRRTPKASRILIVQLRWVSFRVARVFHEAGRGWARPTGPLRRPEEGAFRTDEGRDPNLSGLGVEHS